MIAPEVGPGRVVEVLYDRGEVRAARGARWSGGSGYLIGGRTVLTAAHTVDYQPAVSEGRHLLVRTVAGVEYPARVMLIGDATSSVDLALLELDAGFAEDLPRVAFARVDRDSPLPVRGCWAVGFPRFSEAGPVLPGGSKRETRHIGGRIYPGGKIRGGLLDLEVTATPQGALTGSQWEGMSGAVVFAPDRHGRQLALGVVAEHRSDAGVSELTVVPVTAVAGLQEVAPVQAGSEPAVPDEGTGWWQALGVDDPAALHVLPERPQRQPAGPDRPIAQMTDPFALEVHPAIDAGAKAAGLPALPAYVARDHDEQLRAVVRQAVDGQSAIAVLVGGSSTGKTRACWEALKTLPDGWRLWHPLNPGRPEAAVEAMPRVRPHTVVWLNETQHYLLTPTADLGERVAAGIRELLADPERRPVLVLATLWPEFWATLTTAPAAGQPDSHAQARALLTAADIPVPDVFTGAALAALEAVAGDDPRLAAAQAHAEQGLITQYLAGAPALLERYRNAPAAAKALVDAAMDARRLGHSPALPQTFLHAAAPGYLTDQQWDALGDDWLEQALAYTTAPGRGAGAPLTRIRPRPGEASYDQVYYVLADYLDQYARSARSRYVPPEAFWGAATRYAATPEDLISLGGAAESRWRDRHAEQLYRQAADAGSAATLQALAWMRKEPADRAELFRQAAHAGSTEALRNLAWMREEAGDPAGAEQLYREAVDGGDTDAMRDLAWMREEAGDSAGAEQLADQAAEAGSTGALRELAFLRDQAGDRAAATRLYWRAADAGDTEALAYLAMMREEAGDLVGAEQLARQAADAGGTNALRYLADMRERAGDRASATPLYWRAADAGDTEALGFLALMREETGDQAGAEQLVRQAADAGDIKALRKLAQLRENAGDQAGAEQLYRQAAADGHIEALGFLALMLEEAGDPAGAEQLARQAADAGSTHALRTLAELRKADPLWRRMLQHGLEPDGRASDPW